MSFFIILFYIAFITIFMLTTTLAISARLLVNLIFLTVSSFNIVVNFCFYIFNCITTYNKFTLLLFVSIFPYSFVVFCVSGIVSLTGVSAKYFF